MSTTNTVKQERMHIRLDTLAKQKLEKAATYLNKSLSEFVLSQALVSADEVIKENETLILSADDWEIFMDALENPPEPTKKLKQAFEKHNKYIKA